MGKGELLRLRRDSVILLQAGPVEMHYTSTGTHTIEQGEKMGSCSGISHPHSVCSYLTVLPPPGNMYVTHKQILTLTSKDQTTSVILIQREDLPIQVPVKYLSFQP